MIVLRYQHNLGCRSVPMWAMLEVVSVGGGRHEVYWDGDLRGYVDRIDGQHLGERVTKHRGTVVLRSGEAVPLRPVLALRRAAERVAERHADLLTLQTG